MKKVKITILKTMLNEDLAKEYGIPGLKACPMMKVGDVFYADYAKPKGFCDEAWFYLRINKGKPGHVTGGSLTEVTDGLYLVKAAQPKLTININRWPGQ